MDDSAKKQVSEKMNEAVALYQKIVVFTDELAAMCGSHRANHQIFSYYLDFCQNGRAGDAEDELRRVAKIINRFIVKSKIVDLDDVLDLDVFNFLEVLRSDYHGDDCRARADLAAVFDLLKWQKEANDLRPDKKGLPMLSVISNSAILHPDTEPIDLDGETYKLKTATDPANPIFRQVFEYYKYCDKVRRFSKMSMSTKISCINDFIRFAKITRLEDVTNQLIDDWVENQYNRGCKGRSINGRLAQLSVMLRWERDDNVVMPGLKMSRIPKQKEEPARKVFFNRDQVYAALRVADRRNWLIIKMFFDCGFRISEIRLLRLANIQGKKIIINHAKGGKRRCFWMSDDVRERLDDWIKRENISDWLWPSREIPDAPISDNGLRTSLKKTFRLAGFDDFNPHDLRHSFATDLKKLGVPTRKIQFVLGHSDEATTERYLSDLDGFDGDEVYNLKYAAASPALI